MADNVTLPGTGTVVGADEVTVGGVLQQIQRMKLYDGTDGGTEAIPGSTARGLTVDPRLKVVRLAVTPTISTTTYAIKDAVGGLMTFAGAARAAGGSIRIEEVQLVDHAQEMEDLDLVLFDRSITAPTDNAIFAPSDAELANCIGTIPIGFGMYADFSTNAVAHVPAGISAVLNGTDLFGVLVARTNPTYLASNDLTVTLTISQD